MTIDSISLIAQNAYSKINNQPVSQNIDTKTEAVSFQNMVKVEFNKFAKMSPEQIMQHINSVKSVENSPNSSIIGSAFGELRKKISNQDKVIQDSLIGEASLIDVITAVNDAQKTVTLLTTARDKILESFEKIANMQI